MTTLILYGFPQSSYVRTARMLCIEKGIEHELRPLELGSESHRQLHPWSKMPIMEHGSFRLYETQAICRYIDDVFDGPSFTPKEPKDRAVMEQWISVLNCYLYDDLVRNYVLQYIFPRGADGTPNREVIDRSVSLMSRDLDPIEKWLEGKSWLAGDTLSIADIFYAPLFASALRFPEAKAALSKRPNLTRLAEKLIARPSYQEVQPR